MFGLGNLRGSLRSSRRSRLGGGDLEKRVAALEEAVQDNRALNVRLAAC